jgi:hypothetical protein
VTRQVTAGKSSVNGASFLPFQESKTAVLLFEASMKNFRTPAQGTNRRQEYAYRIAAATAALILLLTWFSA